jgi:hypothetical protein
MPELVAVVDLDRRIEIAFPVLDPRLQAPEMEDAS